MSEYIEDMIELGNEMLTGDEETFQMHSEIKNDSTNDMPVGDPNKSAYKQETNSSFNLIGD